MSHKVTGRTEVQDLAASLQDQVPNIFAVLPFPGLQRVLERSGIWTGLQWCTAGLCPSWAGQTTSVAVVGVWGCFHSQKGLFVTMVTISWAEGHPPNVLHREVLLMLTWTPALNPMS